MATPAKSWNVTCPKCNFTHTKENFVCANCGKTTVDFYYPEKSEDPKFLYCSNCKKYVTGSFMCRNKIGEFNTCTCHISFSFIKSEYPSPCFVVTACYGENNEIVQKFRFYRDNKLSKHKSGQLFCFIYSKIGPSLAMFIKKFPFFRNFSKRVLSWLASKL